jgi:hypothetical protein
MGTEGNVTVVKNQVSKIEVLATFLIRTPLLWIPTREDPAKLELLHEIPLSRHVTQVSTRPQAMMLNLTQDSGLTTIQVNKAR